MDLDLPPPILVQDARGFERLLADLEGQDEIAVDTEADSFFSFREKVCLVQITVEERDYVIDPLAGLDLQPLGRTLADPKKTKVFHDGEYDVLILKRERGFRFAGLFDTRVAAAALGELNPGLASVLRAHFGIELDKSMQRSDWSARPLSERQIRYARLDTRFLIPLMHRQRAQLAERGRLQVVEGECRRLEGLVPPEAAFDADDFAKLKGARELDPIGRRVLRELFALRHRLAEASDLPPFKVLGNQTLVDLAWQRPQTPRELGGIPGLSPRQARRLGPQLLETVAEAQRMPPFERLPQPRPRDGTGGLDEREFELHERLKDWRKGRAVREGYDASLVINRHVLLRLAKDQPRDRAELARIEGLLDWQLEQFGDDLLAVIRAAPPAGDPRRQRRATRRGPPRG